MSWPLNQVTVSQLKVIFSTLGITEERHNKNLEVFKEWIKYQPYLPNDIDDKFLSNFLALSKDDLIKAKRKFEANIIKRKGQKLLSYDWIPSMNELTVSTIRICVPSNELTKEGYRIVYITIPNNPEDIDVEMFLKYTTMISDTLIFEDQSAGVVVVANYDNFTSEILAKMDATVLISYMNFLLQALPYRLMCYHMINTPSILKPIITLVKAVLPEKLKNRIIIHENSASLFDYFTKDLLPVECGGTMSNLDDLAYKWWKFFSENEELRSKLKKLCLRGEVPKEKLHLDPSSGFGTDGTFRNLQVD